MVWWYRHDYLLTCYMPVPPCLFKSYCALALPYGGTATPVLICAISPEPPRVGEGLLVCTPATLQHRHLAARACLFAHKSCPILTVWKHRKSCHTSRHIQTPQYAAWVPLRVHFSPLGEPGPIARSGEAQLRWVRNGVSVSSKCAGKEYSHLGTASENWFRLMVRRKGYLYPWGGGQRLWGKVGVPMYS